MTISLKHAFTSPVSDDNHPDEVGPDEWNAEHLLTQSAAGFLGSASAGSVGLLSVAAAKLLLAITIADVSGLQAALDARALTTTTFTAGAGLTGGGTLASDRTFAVGAGTGITVNADDVALDTSNVRNAAHPGSSTDNALARYDSTAGALQNSTAILGDDGSLTVTAASANLVGTLGVLGSSFTQVDSTSWGQAFSRIGTNLSEAGSAVAGSANQFGLNVQINITAATSSGANYQKAAIIAFARTADPSSGGITRDAVGIDSRGYIASTNATGRAWGGLDWAEVQSGGTGDGILVGREIDVVNNGTSQSSVDTDTSKYGLTIYAYGSASSTAAIRIGQGTGSSAKWHKILYADAAHMEASSTFLELKSKFVVNQDGKLSIGLNAATAKLTLSDNAAAGAPAFTGAVAHLIGADSATIFMLVDGLGAAPVVAGRRAQGTLASPTAVTADISLLALQAFGYEGTTPGYVSTARVQILLRAAQTWTSTAQGAYLSFLTTDSGGTSTTEKMRLYPSGGLAVGTLSDLGAGGFSVINGLATIAQFMSTAAGNNVFNFGTVPSTGVVNDSVGVNVTLAFTSGTQYQAGLFRLMQTNATSGSEVTIWSFFARRAGTLNESLRIDYPSTAAQTGLMIYDVDNNALERVTVGAADSGGVGFKVLRIAN